MKLRLACDLTKREIEEYVKEYEQSWDEEDRKLFEKMHKALRKGFLTGRELYEIARWKTIRSSKMVGNNPDWVVREITKLALKMPDDEYKIRILTSLKGIGIPRASAILAMQNPKKYGVIDVNAWFALTGRRKQGFNAKNWIWYLKEIRRLARKHGKTPRQIDMALMKYGQKLQRKASR